jgi:hypothetical protein
MGFLKRARDGLLDGTLGLVGRRQMVVIDQDQQNFGFLLMQRRQG